MTESKSFNRVATIIFPCDYHIAADYFAGDCFVHKRTGVDQKWILLFPRGV